MTTKGYVIFDQDGLVVEAGTGRFPPTEAVSFTPPLDPSLLNQMMLVQRPMSPEVQSTGTDHTVADCPLGTLVEVYDVTTPGAGELMTAFEAAADDEIINVSLPDPGVYRIEVKAPLPYLPRYVEVIVE